MRQTAQNTDMASNGSVGKRQSWSRALNAILSARPVDRGAARILCMEICRAERDTLLGAQACRAYAALRQLQTETASELLVRAAVRELEAVSHALMEAQRRPFGKCQSGGSLILERRLLNLPATGPLSANEINAAFRVAAHESHPDHGGSTERFIRLLAARDSLLREMK